MKKYGKKRHGKVAFFTSNIFAVKDSTSETSKNFSGPPLTFWFTDLSLETLPKANFVSLKIVGNMTPR